MAVVFPLGIPPWVHGCDPGLGGEDAGGPHGASHQAVTSHRSLRGAPNAQDVTRIFPEINHPAIGVPHLRKPSYIYIYVCVYILYTHSMISYDIYDEI